MKEAPAGCGSHCPLDRRDSCDKALSLFRRNAILAVLQLMEFAVIPDLSFAETLPGWQVLLGTLGP